MYYHSKNRAVHVIHTEGCFHLANRGAAEIGVFSNLEEAYRAGYRLCRYCSPIARQYRKESDALTEYCRRHAASFFFHDQFIGVHTPHSKWRILPVEGSDTFVLYHKNTFMTNRDGESAVPGYHLQQVSRDTVQGYLEYIVAHEDYRMRHPVAVRPEKKEKAPPRKGTKRYRKQQEKAARYAKKCAIANVLNLIDNLSAPAAVMA